jgi:hypothetical protein
MTSAAVVTICGSMRFYDQMLTMAADGQSGHPNALVSMDAGSGR